MKKYKPKTKQELKELVLCGKYLGDIDTSLITDMSFLFADLDFNDSHIGYIEVGKIIATPYFFPRCSRSDFSGIESWDVSNVTRFNGMFYGCKNFNEPLESWNVSKAIEMNAMFFECKNFNQSLNNWDIRNLKKANFMFFGCDSLNQSFKNWLKPQSISALAFSGLSAKTLGLKINQVKGKFQPINKDELKLLVSDESVNLGSIDTSLIKDMSNLFSGWHRVMRKDFSGIESWDVSNVENMSKMFYNCFYFNEPIGCWDISKVADMSYMFHHCCYLNQNLNSWDLSKVAKTKGMFSECFNFDPFNVKGTKDMFKWQHLRERKRGRDYELIGTITENFKPSKF